MSGGTGPSSDLSVKQNKQGHLSTSLERTGDQWGNVEISEGIIDELMCGFLHSKVQKSYIQCLSAAANCSSRQEVTLKRKRP